MHASRLKMKGNLNIEGSLRPDRWPFAIGDFAAAQEPLLYRLVDLRARSFLRGDYQTTWGWAKVFLKALVE